MRIEKVEALPVIMPLSRTFVISQGITQAFKSVLVKIHTDEGITGVGECVTSTSFRDENLEGIKTTIDNYLAPAIIGLDPFDMELILERMDARVTRNYQSKAGVDCALFDLQGKALDLPVHRLLGGQYSKQIEVTFTLSASENEEIGAIAKKMVASGYSTLVVKLEGNEKKDIERFKVVREAVGGNIKLRADANQGYHPDKAIGAIRKLERYEPELVEQPVSRWDLSGMSKVARSVDTPISADESNVSIHDAMQIIRMEAADILNIKVPKNGGLYLSKKIAAIAEAANIPCLVGGMMTLEIARQASRHFAASTKQVRRGYASDGCGPASQSITDNITKHVITYDDVKRLGGYVEVTDAPGLGVQLDDEKVRKYSQSHLGS